jgi:hypothetical protein
MKKNGRQTEEKKTNRFEVVEKQGKKGIEK